MNDVGELLGQQIQPQAKPLSEADLEVFVSTIKAIDIDVDGNMAELSSAVVKWSASLETRSWGIKGIDITIHVVRLFGEDGSITEIEGHRCEVDRTGSGSSSIYPDGLRLTATGFSISRVVVVF